MGTRSGRRQGRDRPLRVFFLHENTMGHRTFVQNIKPALNAYDDIQVRWLALDNRYFAAAGQRIPRLLNHWALWGSAQALLVALRACAGGRPDVLVLHTQSVAQLAWPLLRRIPSVVSLDATELQLAAMADVYDNVPPGDSPYDRAVRWFNRRVYQAAGAIMVKSSWVKGSLVADYGVDPAAVVVNPDGVDLDYWRPGDAADGAGRVLDPAGSGAEGGAAGGGGEAGTAPVRVLFVGGDFRRKGGDLLLAALRGIERPWELHLVTGAALPADALADPRVRVHRGLGSNDPRLAALYRACDVFALPTRGDCSPNVCVEAMASGLPVVTTRTGGVPEMVAEGETGLVVAPGDGAALRGALERLLGDGALRRRLGAAGRRRAVAGFDARRCAAVAHGVIRAAHARRAPTQLALGGQSFADSALADPGAPAPATVGQEAGPMNGRRGR